MHHIIANLGKSKVTQEIFANEYEQGRSSSPTIFAPRQLMPSITHLNDVAQKEEMNKQQPPIATLLDALYNVGENMDREEFSRAFLQCSDSNNFKPLARILNTNVIIIQPTEKVSHGIIATCKQSKTALIDTREACTEVVVDTLTAITDVLLNNNITDTYVVSKLYSATQLKRLAQSKGLHSKLLKADLIKLILGAS